MMGNHMEFGMPLSEAMETQRAIRRLKPDPVDDEVVLRLIDLALRAPTGSNAQSWEFIVVRDPKIKKGLARLNRQAWQLGRRFARWTTGDSPKSRKILNAVQWQVDHFEEVPVIVIACLKGFYIPFLHISTSSYFGSIFPSVQNLLLAGRCPDYTSIMEPHRCPQNPRSTLERHTLCSDSSRLAPRALRPYNAKSCSRSCVI